MDETEQLSVPPKAIIARREDLPIPGTVVRSGIETICYLRRNGQTSRTVFRLLLDKDRPRSATWGAMFQNSGSLTTPTGAEFAHLQIHGNVEGWRDGILWAAKKNSVTLAMIRDDMLEIDNGERYAVSDCVYDSDA